MMCCLSPEELENRRISDEIDKRLKMDKKNAKREIKLLLLGTGESGKSTFIKQMRIIHGDGFSEDEKKQYYSKLVYQNIFMSMQSMIRNIDILEISYDKPEHRDLADLLMIVSYENVNNLREPYLSAIKTLWADSGIQECYERRSEYQLIDSANYFLDKIDVIGKPDYMPCNDDVLHSRSATTGILQYSFEMPPFTMRMIDVGGQRSERKKWLHCFDNIQLLIFLVAISEYDQLLQESENVNRLTESKSLFKTIVESTWFVNSSIVLFLNKNDLLNEKIEKKHLVDFCPDYTGPKKDAKAARDYFAKTFTNLNNNKLRTIYTHFTCATDTDNIKRVSAAVKDMIMSKLLKIFHFN